MMFSVQDSVGQGLINQLGNSQSRMSSIFRQMSSGSQINQAVDGPALLNQISTLNSQILGNNQAMGNINDGISLTQVADGGLGQIGDSLQQLRELAVQGANDTLSSTDRANLQAQADQIQSQINDVIANTQFNGQNLLASGQTLNLQTGSGATDQTSLALPNLAGSFAAIDLTTQTGAASAISSIDTGLDTLSQARSQMGASQSGLQASLSSLQSSDVTAQGARSSLQDTNYAQASADMVSTLVKQKFDIALQGQINKLSAGSLSLLH